MTNLDIGLSFVMAIFGAYSGMVSESRRDRAISIALVFVGSAGIARFLGHWS